MYENQRISDMRQDVKRMHYILKEMNDQIYNTDMGLMIYDEQRGYWTNDSSEHLKIFIDYSVHLFNNRDDIEKNNTFYSLYVPVYELLKAKAPYKKWDHNASKGYLLFNNGVLDMYNFTMIEKSHTFYFINIINRNFNIANDFESCKTCLHNFFDTIYTTEEKKDYILEQLAKAVAGNNEKHEYMISLFGTKQNKLDFANLLHTAIGSFIIEFDSEQLVQDTLDWAKIKKSRISITNNIKNLSNETVNKLVSHVDDNLLFKNIESLINTSYVLILSTNAPSVGLVDDYYIEKTNFLYVDTANPNPLEITTELCDGFICVLCDIYKKNIDNGDIIKPEFAKLNMLKIGMEWLGDNYTLHTGNVYNDFFRLSKGRYYPKWNLIGDNWTPFDEIYTQYLQDGNVQPKENFMQMLDDNGFPATTRKINRVSTIVRIGIKEMEY